jgi:hypothetical protein
MPQDDERPRPSEQPDEAPETPPDEPRPAPVEDPPSEPDRPPYVVKVAAVPVGLVNWSEQPGVRVQL